MDILCLLLDHYSGIKPSALVLQPLKSFLGETSVFLEHLAFNQHGTYVFFQVSPCFLLFLVTATELLQ